MCGRPSATPKCRRKTDGGSWCNALPKSHSAVPYLMRRDYHTNTWSSAPQQQPTINCFHFGKEFPLLLSSTHTTHFRYHGAPIRALSTSTLAHALPADQGHRTPIYTFDLSYVFGSRATHARTLLPAAFVSVPSGFALVRIRI